MRKVLAATITCLIVLLCAMPSIAQTASNAKFDVRLQLKSSDCITKKIVLQVQVKAHDAASTFKMGDANYRFDYDPAVVNNPVNISQENFSSSVPARDFNYFPQSLTGSKVSNDGTQGIVSLNTFFSGSASGAKTVGVEYMTVACIQFDIVNTAGCVNFKWRKNDPAIDFPITGMNEIIQTSVDPDPFDFQNPIVAAGGVFESYNVCLNTLCLSPNVDAISNYFNTNINTPVTGNALTNDLPTTGLTVKTTSIGSPLHGSISINSAGAFTYTPATGFVGKDSVQYEACNAGSLCDKAYLVFTITGPAPVANRDVYATNINTAITGNVLNNDTPSGSLTVKISPFPTPLHGSLTLSSNGAFTYTPANGYVGKDSIQYEACDGNNQCVKAWAVFTITGPAPVANRDVYATNINTAVTGNVLNNDTPSGSLTVKISPFPTPLHGSLTLSSNGAFTYTPANGYIGKDSIQYEACNTNNQCVKAWTVFTITGPAPVANRDVYATNINTAVTGNVLNNDTPSGSLTVKISPFPTPLHGSLTLSSNGAFTYTPANGYVGKDSIQYEACNTNNQCVKAWAVFTITGPAPVANRDVYATNINTAVTGNVLNNDTPSGSLTVKISPFPTPLHGSLTLSSNGAFTYTPANGYIGKDSIQYEACNTNNQCVKAWTVFTITGPAPVANRDVYATNINTAVTGNVLNNDTPSGSLTVKISPFPTPLHGSLTLSSNGAFTYTPANGYVGKDSIQYEACNTNNQCTKAWAVFTITGSAPVANRDVYSTNINTAVTGNVLNNDTPSGSLTVKISPFPTPLHGSLTLSSNGAFTYTPANGYVGKDSIQYEACDGNNQCVKAWAVFTITGPAPVANRDVYVTNINTAVTGIVLNNDTPSGSLTVKISPFPTPLHGSLTLSSNGAFTYTPANGYVGKDSIQYEACDGNNQCVKAWAVFTITGPAPVANRDVYATNINTAVTGNVLTNDTPASGLTVKVPPATSPLHGSLSLATDGAFIYTPTAGYVGKDSVQYEACNTNNQCSKAWAVFTVSGPAPAVIRDVYSTNQNTPVSGNVLANDTPNGGLTVKISPFPTPLHGSLTLSTNGAFTYTPANGYVGKDSIQYEACNGNNQCAKAWAVFTTNGIINPQTEVDLSLIKTINQKKIVIGDLVTYTISLTNQSNNAGSGISVKDYMPAGVVFKSFSTSTGTFNSTTGVWTVGNIAPQQTINLMITVQATSQGTFFNRAEVLTADQIDPDSKPGNTFTTGLPVNPILEDDNASICFYVPIEICSGSGDEYDITVPQGYQGIQWYKNGTAINGATASTLRVNSAGLYTFTTLVGNCPTGGCCPAEFVNVNCCKPDVCVPYSVTKTKSGKK
jgi:uncharacterized repeat protein (TIGR01451 family)